jgi:hypothetical protein
VAIKEIHDPTGNLYDAEDELYFLGKSAGCDHVLPLLDMSVEGLDLFILLISLMF